MKGTLQTLEPTSFIILDPDRDENPSRRDFHMVVAIGGVSGLVWQCGGIRASWMACKEVTALETQTAHLLASHHDHCGTNVLSLNLRAGLDRDLSHTRGSLLCWGLHTSRIDQCHGIGLTCEEHSIAVIFFKRKPATQTRKSLVQQAFFNCAAVAQVERASFLLKGQMQVRVLSAALNLGRAIIHGSYRLV